jgi:hypothetical protein
MNHSTCAQNCISKTPITCISRVYVREIGNMDEGIVEGCEDTGDTKDEFTWRGVSFLEII